MAVKPCVLITRPEPQAQQLASKLEHAGYSAVCQPLFTYQAKDTLADLTTLLSQSPNPILIFVSKAAVTFAQQIKPILQWQAKSCIAVGSATAQALAELGINQVITPKQHDSEGVLSLAALNYVKEQSVIIVRGNGGRELMAEQLTKRGAKTAYFESYQRCWLTLPKTTVQHWQQQNINVIWITSNAILESVVQLIQGGDNFWQNTCLWFLASPRIAEKANELGLKRVICTHGASDNAFIDALNQLEQNK